MVSFIVALPREELAEICSIAGRRPALARQVKERRQTAVEYTQRYRYRDVPVNPYLPASSVRVPGYPQQCVALVCDKPFPGVPREGADSPLASCSGLH